LLGRMAQMMTHVVVFLLQYQMCAAFSLAKFTMTEPLILRRAALSDVYAVRELSKAAYAKWVPLIGREPMPMTAKGRNFEMM
jgi:hypothetical protein